MACRASPLLTQVDKSSQDAHDFVDDIPTVPVCYLATVECHLVVVQLMQLYSAMELIWKQAKHHQLANFQVS